MLCQLPADCLNKIFEYLEDEIALRSCSLVNRLWCEVAIEILWAKVQNYNTLIACLLNESKEILYKNEIIISTSTSRPLLFNYVTFVKNLSIDKVCEAIDDSQGYDKKKCILVAQEIFKMLMDQITCKTLIFYLNSSPISYIQNIPFTTYPGAIDCLRNLSELKCDSIIHSEFFTQLSKIYHNI